MRVSNQSTRAAIALTMGLSVLLAACGTAVAPSSPPPTIAPTPVITPDPHLVEPATADQVFNAIRVGDLPLFVNNASTGGPNAAVVKRINADIGNWPLIITEFRTSAALHKAIKWDRKKPIGQGSPPYAFIGLNILIEFGPITGKLAEPDASRQKQAVDLVALIDPLLWPLQERTVIPIPTRTAVPASAPPAGKPTPKPSK
jgi:hypothetical protein